MPQNFRTFRPFGGSDGVGNAGDRSAPIARRGHLPASVAPVDVGALAGLTAVGLMLWLEPPLAAAGTLLAAATLAAAASPMASVTAVVAALPLAYRPVTLGGGTYSLLELAIVTGSVGIALAVLGAVRRADGRARLLEVIGPRPITLAAIGVLCAGTVSLAFVAQPDRLAESLREYRWTIVEPLAFLGMCRWAFGGEADRSLPVAAFCAVAAVVGLAALGESLSGRGVVDTGESIRAKFLYPHPNNLAFYLERAGVFAAGLALVGPWRSFTATAAICALAGLAATLSRGATLGAIAGLGVILYFVGTRRAWLAFAGLIGAIVVALAILADGRLRDLGGADGEATRLPIWRSSIRMILDHPVTGVGLDQFHYQYWRRYVEPAGWPERYTSHPHNLVLDVWLRLGILGLAAFGWLVAALALVARRLPRHPPSGGGVAVASLAALVAGATHGLVDNGYFLPDVAVMTWFMIALFERQATGASTEPS